MVPLVFSVSIQSSGYCVCVCGVSHVLPVAQQRQHKSQPRLLLKVKTGRINKNQKTTSETESRIVRQGQGQGQTMCKQVLRERDHDQEMRKQAKGQNP